jgi:hypothetical protein
MIQLGYCIPVLVQPTPTHTDVTTDDVNGIDSHLVDVDENEDDTETAPVVVTAVSDGANYNYNDSIIGHTSTDWTTWDGGQIGGTPTWLNPEYIPSVPLYCHCTNTKCQCYSLNHQNNNTATNTSEALAHQNKGLVEGKNDLNDDDDTDNHRADTNIQQQRQQATDSIDDEAVVVPKGDVVTRGGTHRQPPKKSSNTAPLLHFIGQLYAPPPPSLDKNTTTNAAFHRTLYIFACTQCHLSRCYHRIRIVRTQLPKLNPYWPSTNQQQQHSTEPWISHLPSTYYNLRGGLCIICNFPARGKCPMTQQTFCSTDHQRLYYFINRRSRSNNNTQPAINK